MFRHSGQNGRLSGMSGYRGGPEIACMVILSGRLAPIRPKSLRLAENGLPAAAGIGKG